MHKQRNTSFQPDEPVSARITASLERIARAFRVLLWQESVPAGLTPIQIQVLLFLYTSPPERRKVSYLAREFTLSKPTISETIRILSGKALIRKEKAEDDRRSYTINLTPEGKRIAREAYDFAMPVQNAIETLDAQQKIDLFEALTTIIGQLNRKGIIHPMGMCMTCRFYRSGYMGQKHYCELMKKPLSVPELRINCPDHQLVT